MLVVLVAIMPVLAGCDSFDPDNLDIFGLSGKDKLPGKRELLFPGGVPGVTQGIPPQYVEGYKSPLESEPLPPGDSDNPQTANAAGAPAAAAARKAGHPTAMAHGRPMQIAPVRESSLEKPKPRHRTVRRKPTPKATETASRPPARKPARKAASKPQSKPEQTASQPGGTNAPWPSTPPQQTQAGWPGSQSQQQKLAPWPSAPPSGSFSK